MDDTGLSLAKHERDLPDEAAAAVMDGCSRRNERAPYHGSAAACLSLCCTHSIHHSKVYLKLESNLRSREPMHTRGLSAVFSTYEVFRASYIFGLRRKLMGRISGAFFL